MSNNVRFSHWPRTPHVGYDGADAVVYDDAQTSAQVLRLPASSNPTWRTYDYGIGGGVDFPALGFAIGDYVEFFIETQHSQQLNSTLAMHLHYTLPSDSATDKIKFQLDVAAAPIGASYAAVAGSPFSAEHELVGDEAAQNNILGLGAVPAVNTTISTLYVCRLTRVAEGVDDYAPEVYVSFVDGHVALDTLGSLQPTSKV